MSVSFTELQVSYYLKKKKKTSFLMSSCNNTHESINQVIWNIVFKTQLTMCHQISTFGKQPFYTNIGSDAAEPKQYKPNKQHQNLHVKWLNVTWQTNNSKAFSIGIIHNSQIHNCQSVNMNFK